MYKLNLETKTKEQELIKEYLQNNVSEIIADKINNGVKVTKDNKTFVNKKDLGGFMRFATDEAKKQAEKGAQSACIEDKVVFGWAMHYFEEDTLEGKLYNEDGTEYKPVIKTTPKPTTPIKTETKKETSKQATLFDFMVNDNKQENNEKDEDNDEEDCDCEEEIEEQKSNVPDYYNEYHECELSYPNIVVLTKLGDFYEAMNENAERIANVLDLVLTSKDVGLENKVKLAGFPYHVKDDYCNRLSEQYDIMILENGEQNFIKKKQTKLEQTNTIDKYTLKTIASLLDGKVVLK